MPTRKLDPEGGGLGDPISIGKGNEPFFIRVWKSLPNRRVLKFRGEAQKGKPKENGICLQKL